MKPKQCPECGAKPFKQLLPMFVVRWPFKFLLWGARPEYAVICRDCKEIVDYEWFDEAWRALREESLRMA